MKDIKITTYLNITLRVSNDYKDLKKKHYKDVKMLVKSTCT